MLKQEKQRYLIGLVLIGLYIFFCYGVRRYESVTLISIYSVLFGFYLWISFGAEDINAVKFWVRISIVIRFSILFSLPTLSDDFYRFIWDGQLLENGYHPFEHMPDYYKRNNIIWPGASVYSLLNSPNYYTIYPPLAQYSFWLAVKIVPNSILSMVIVLRLIIIASEACTLKIISLLLKKLNLPARNILFYALNPLVIIELTGNLHHEGMLVLFVLLCVYSLIQDRIILSATFFSFAIGIKLIPALFLPVLLRRLPWKKAILFAGLSILTTAIIWFPLLDLRMIHGYQNSIGYYFNKFEFNASLFYIIRSLGYLFNDFNTIVYIGKWMGVCATILILAYSLSLKRKVNISNANMLFIDFGAVLLIFFIFALTLHPWYIISLLALSIFTSYRFVVCWTALIFLTYLGYSKDSFHEVYSLTFLEYGVVIAFFIWEFRRFNNVARA